MADREATPAPPPGRPEVPVATLAHMCNLTTRRIQQLAKDGVIPKARRGRYDVVASVRAYCAWMQERATGRAADVSDLRQQTAEEQLRKLRAENDARAGRLVPLDDVIAEARESSQIIVAALEAIPGRVAPELVDLDDPVAIARVLKREIRATRASIAAHLKDS